MKLKKVKILSLLTFTIITACNNDKINTYPTVQPISAPTFKDPECNSLRWMIKYGADTDASSISIDNPERATIIQLLNNVYPGSTNLADDKRYTTFENKAYSLSTTLVGYKLENNKEYNLTLKDHQGNMISARIPEPSCISNMSPFLPGILDSRKEFDLQFKPTKKFKAANKGIKITGIGFFSTDVLQPGETNIQLNPVVSLSFGN